MKQLTPLTLSQVERCVLGLFEEAATYPQQNKVVAGEYVFVIVDEGCEVSGPCGLSARVERRAELAILLASLKPPRYDMPRPVADESVFD